MIGGREGRIATSQFRYMLTEVELKMAVQALSHIWPTESREPDASFGNACDLIVADLRCGRGRFAVAVDVMMLPLGTMTWTAGLELDIGRWCKCLVIWWK
jgi:hypothetical protein